MAWGAGAGNDTDEARRLLAKDRSRSGETPVGQSSRLLWEVVMSRRKVLVPLDGSDFSRMAFRGLARLFDSETTHVTLVHVTPVPEGVPHPIPEPIVLAAQGQWPQNSARQSLFSSQEWESARAEVLPKMDDDATRLRQAGFQVTKVVRFGDPAQEIADLVDGEDFDAVVMATHGRSGLSRALLGSVAESVLHMVLTPVVMVRATDKENHQLALDHWG